jgi:hypothetical protein
MLQLAFIQTVSQFARGQMVTAIGLSVLVLGIGAGIAAKIDGRTGGIVMIAATLFGLYVLKVNGIFNL